MINSELCSCQTSLILFVEQQLSTHISIDPVWYTISIDDFFQANSEDLARNKPAIQTTDYDSYWVAGNAVDGNYDSYSCTIRYDSNPYWSVDLGMSTYVDHLYITNVERRNGELIFISR